MINVNTVEWFTGVSQLLWVRLLHFVWLAEKSCAIQLLFTQTNQSTRGHKLFPRLVSSIRFERWLDHRIIDLRYDWLMLVVTLALEIKSAID